MPKHCKTKVLPVSLNDISKPFVLNKEDPWPQILMWESTYIGDYMSLVKAVFCTCLTINLKMFFCAVLAKGMLS